MISLLQQAAGEVGKAAASMADSAAGAPPASEHATGMPQLDHTTFANQTFWLVIALVAIWWILTRVALPRISALLTDRENAIASDLGAAEALRAKAREAEAAYDAALAQARAEAQGIAAEQRAKMQAEIDAAVAQADADIAARATESERRIAEIRASAVSDARQVARDVTADLLRAFEGMVDEKAIAAAVDRQVQEVA